MLLLVDGSNVMHRAYHALPELTSRGRPVGMVKGFANTLIRLLRTYKPSHAVVAFDTACEEGPVKYFRMGKFPAYKGNRNAPQDDFLAQVEPCKIIAVSLGFQWIESRGWEADDIIATLAWKVSEALRPILVCSGDKDIRQILSYSNVCIEDPASQMIVDASWFERMTGVDDPELLTTYLALVGDASDNLPGVPGIGPKAAKMLVKLGDLPEVYRRIFKERDLPEGVTGRIVKLLDAHRELAFLMLDLVTLNNEIDWVDTHIPLSVSASATEIHDTWRGIGIKPPDDCANFLCQKEWPWARML